MLTAVACIVLTAALFAWVFSAKPEAPDSAAAVRRQALEERKHAVFENLKDLHFEHLAGKLSDPDYQRARQMLEDEAARVTAALSAFPPAA